MAAQPAFVAKIKPSCVVTFTDADGETETYTRASWDAAVNLIASKAREIFHSYPFSHRQALEMLADSGLTVAVDGEVLA